MADGVSVGGGRYASPDAMECLRRPGAADGGGDEASDWTAFQYDPLERLVAVTNEFRAKYTGTLKPLVTKYTYDELGNMTNEIKVVYDTNSYCADGCRQNAGHLVRVQ